MFTELAYAMGPAQEGGQGGGLIGFLPLIAIFAIFYFLLIRPQQKKAKEQKAMVESLKKGDKVITSGGIYGIIEEVRTNTVSVKISENVRVKIGRTNIAVVRQAEDD